MDYSEFNSINDITLKLINQNSSSEQLDEYNSLCIKRLKKARLETDTAIQNLSKLNRIRQIKVGS